MNTERLVSLAVVMGLSPLQAAALPVAVEVAARKVGMTEDRFISEMERIPELRDYLKTACVAGEQELVPELKERA